MRHRERTDNYGLMGDYNIILWRCLVVVLQNNYQLHIYVSFNLLRLSNKTKLFINIHAPGFQGIEVL